MNLTHLIEETGKRIRLGKPPSDRLTNTEIKEVLETTIEVLKEALIEEGRVEIQLFCVIEVRCTMLQSTIPLSSSTVVQRVNWIIRPTQALRRAVHEGRRTKQK